MDCTILLLPRASSWRGAYLSKALHFYTYIQGTDKQWLYQRDKYGTEIYVRSGHASLRETNRYPISSYKGGYKEFCRLGCNAVQSAESQPMFGKICRVHLQGWRVRHAKAWSRQLHRLTVNGLHSGTSQKTELFESMLVCAAERYTLCKMNCRSILQYSCLHFK
jgi:hypothetical protein